jgi:ABC-type uncharacterized transport system involved in gliding motility auxiliary subunit
MVFVLVITFSAISICQNVGGRLKIDVTGQKLYTLSAGTKAILAKLNQPIKLKLYYAKTAAMKGPDQIKYFNNYYEFVRALLEEYVAAAKGMVTLQIIDPRPFSDDEVDAARYGLKRFPITEEENFVFGLVVQTQFGVDKAVPFFSPDRQNFVEYDISHLIDTVITRQKKNIGVLSSLPIMGDDTSPYMAYMMRMQGQAPRPPWTIIEHLRQQYEVKGIATDVNEINDVDILLVIHPKNLPERTLFAIDQFVLKGGRMVVCVDPYCYADQQNPMAGQLGGTSQESNLNKLLNTWGLDMPGLTFAGDRNLTDQRAEQIIGFLNLKAPACFNRNSVIAAQLNIVRVWFAGVLNEINPPNDVNGRGKIERTPLIMTTAKGNSFKVDSPLDLQMLDPASFGKNFTDGNKPVVMGYLTRGKIKTSFPNGIEAKSSSKKDTNDTNTPRETTVHITGLTEAAGDCAVAVFSDVDFISDGLAYQKNQLFGTIIVGDNSALLMNAIDDLIGSSDLISIRSRGNFQRPFTVVDDIEAQADASTAGEVAKLNDEIAGLEDELRKLITSKSETEKQIIGSSIVQKTRALELKKLKAQRQLREVRMQRRQRIEHLGNVLRNFNMLAAPAVILIIAMTLGVRRSAMKRHYISHASDA